MFHPFSIAAHCEFTGGYITQKITISCHQWEIQAVTSGELSASEDATSRAKFCPSTLPRKLETKMPRHYPNGEYFLATRNQDMESLSHRKGGFKRSIRMAEIEEVSFDQPEKVQNKKHGNVTNRNGILRREQTWHSTLGISPSKVVAGWGVPPEIHCFSSWAGEKYSDILLGVKSSIYINLYTWVIFLSKILENTRGWRYSNWPGGLVGPPASPLAQSVGRRSPRIVHLLQTPAPKLCPTAAVGGGRLELTPWIVQKEMP